MNGVVVMRISENHGEERLDEDEIDIPGAESGGVTDCCCKAAPIGDGSRRYGLANARQWRQSHLNKPVIGWMPDQIGPLDSLLGRCIKLQSRPNHP